MYQNIIVPIDHGNRNMKTEQRIPYMRDKTMDNHFFILTLFGIAVEAAKKAVIQDNMVFQVDLPIGLPPKHYGALYQKFENYFRGRGSQIFTYKGKRYEIEIG